MHSWRDKFGKRVINALLRPFVPVEIEREIVGHSQRADIWVESGADEPERPELGVLGRMIALGACIIEPFSQTPRVPTVRACICKQGNLYSELTREARRKKQPSPSFPRLWIISPGLPKTAMKEVPFEIMESWPDGFYQGGSEWLRLHIVVLSELPGTPDTLALRLLGRNRTLTRALQEFRALPDSSWSKPQLAPILVAFQRQIPQNLQDGETIMQVLQEIDAFYEEWERQTKEEARKEGRKALEEARKEGREALEEARKEGREALEEARRNASAVLFHLLDQRFGTLTDDVRRRILAADMEQLTRWTKRVIPAQTPDDIFD